MFFEECRDLHLPQKQFLEGNCVSVESSSSLSSVGFASGPATPLTELSVLR